MVGLQYYYDSYCWIGLTGAKTIVNVHTHSIYFLEVGHKIWRAKVTRESLGRGALDRSSGTDSLALRGGVDA